jgi:hypothetical protein
LRLGEPVVPAIAYWLWKPAGTSYREFEAAFAPLVANGCSLWGRRMTLGPTPEFCLHAPAPRNLPHPAVSIDLRAVSLET